VHCYQKIEGAILNLYNYASVREFGTPFLEHSRITTLQENLETAAEETEKAERAVIRHSNLVTEARLCNTAILSRNSLNLAVLPNRIPQEKLQEFDRYPLAFSWDLFIQFLKMNLTLQLQQLLMWDT